MTDFREHPDPIRFNVPGIEGHELAYLEQSLREGHTASSGSVQRPRRRGPA